MEYKEAACIHVTTKEYIKIILMICRGMQVAYGYKYMSYTVTLICSVQVDSFIHGGIIKGNPLIRPLATFSFSGTMLSSIFSRSSCTTGTTVAVEES